ncbi:MAG: G8 domain-containing protein, partial [Bacteroidota bacterium]|nr:G8 domain-containing protein [Bacteroidota bacterium]
MSVQREKSYNQITENTGNTALYFLEKTWAVILLCSLLLLGEEVRTQGLSFIHKKSSYHYSPFWKTIAPITSTPSGGAWNNASTWLGGIIPTANDDAVIVAGATVTVTTNPATCLNLTIDGTLTINSSFNLDVNGNWTNNGAFNASTGSISFLG